MRSESAQREFRCVCCTQRVNLVLGDPIPTAQSDVRSWHIPGCDATSRKHGPLSLLVGGTDSTTTTTLLNPHSLPQQQGRPGAHNVAAARRFILTPLWSPKSQDPISRAQSPISDLGPFPTIICGGDSRGVVGNVAGRFARFPPHSAGPLAVCRRHFRSLRCL